MYTYDLIKKGVVLGTAVTIPLYVAGYYPPEKQGDKHPPHEHTDVSTGGAAQPIVIVAQPGSAISFRAGTRWPIRF